jgi:glucose-1-phosphate cytidylyltransferase
MHKTVKAVILAGGKGTRLMEETRLSPKPMVEIGGRPILWHIMKSYLYYGIQDFIICTGYLGYKIKDYFLRYALQHADITITSCGTIKVHESHAEAWSVTLVDTGDDTMTGGRLKRIRPYVADDAYFCMTYGDGLCDVNIASLIDFHHTHGGLATVTAVRPNARFGAVQLNGSLVTGFIEKPTEEGGMISGGFFVMSPRVLDYIEGDGTSFELAPLQALAQEGELHAFRHEGFWQPMDTMRDRHHLERLWLTGAPWRKWA